MTAIPEDFLDLFEKRTFAHVATMTANGVPHVTPVWIDYDADRERLLVNTERGRQKERNVAHDPNVGASMTDPENAYRWLSVLGEVDRVTTEGARAHIDELSQRYTGDDYQNPIQTERVILEVRIDEVLSSS